MKIIEDKTAKQVTCTHCKSILEVSKKDIHTGYSEYAGVMYSDDYFYCPCCGRMSYIDYEKRD